MTEFAPSRETPEGRVAFARRASGVVLSVAVVVLVSTLLAPGCSRDDSASAPARGSEPRAAAPQPADEAPEAEIARLVRSFAAGQTTAQHRFARERLATLLPGRIEAFRTVIAEFEAKAMSGHVAAADVLDNVCDVIQLAESEEGASLALSWVKAPQPTLRLKAVQTVAAMPPPSASLVLAERAVDASEAMTVRLAALEGLGLRGDPSIAPRLRPLLEDESSPPELLSRAVAALGLLGDRDSADRLHALATTVDSPVSMEAIRALVRMGDPRGLEKIEPLASSADAHFRLQAATLLATVPTDSSLGRLAAMAGDSEAAVRQTVVGGLSTAPPGFDAERTLRALASDSDAGVRRGSLFAAGKSGALWALEALRASAADPKSADRVASMVSLGRCRDRASVPPFLAVAGDGKETPQVRIVAVNNLARIGDASVLPRLLAIAASAEGANEKGEPLWRVMAIGLANFGAEAIPQAVEFYSKATTDAKGKRVVITLLSFIGGKSADAARRALEGLLSIETEPELRAELEAVLSR